MKALKGSSDLPIEDVEKWITVASKAKNAFHSWMHGDPAGPPSRRNCFSLSINGYRIFDAIGAGDTMADANLMGDHLLSRINQELHFKDPSTVLQLQTSTLPFVVEVADGNKMQLTQYVEMNIALFVPDDRNADSEYELELPVGKPVVVWVAKGNMEDILFGASCLHENWGINIRDALSRHPSAKRVLKPSVGEPRTPQPERVCLFDLVRLLRFSRHKCRLNK
jgi:hypothetical protein